MYALRDGESAKSCVKVQWTSLQFATHYQPCWRGEAPARQQTTSAYLETLSDANAKYLGQWTALHLYPPLVLMHTWLGPLQPALPELHSSISTSKLLLLIVVIIISPRSCTPLSARWQLGGQTLSPMHSLPLSLSLKPAGHVHLNDPGVFSQNPLHSLPLVAGNSHSFTSATTAAH